MGRGARAEDQKRGEAEKDKNKEVLREMREEIGMCL